MENDLLELYRLESSFSDDRSTTIHTVFHGESRREYTERWRTVEEIGAGAMGTVVSEREEKTGRKRAVKTVYKPMLKGRIDYRRELLAMGILSKYSHAFVQFLGWYEDAQNLYLAMELFEAGDLRKYLLANGPQLPESECKLIGFQIFRALEYMHQHGFTHRDLKPENIFVASTKPLHLKIGDFGISKRATASTGLHTRAYTPDYAAPEVVLTSSSASYTSKVDIWSAGCVLYKVLTGGTPFKEPMEMYHFCMRTGDADDSEPAKMLKEHGVGQEGVTFLLGLLKAKAEERPTAKQAREMQWVSSWKENVDDGEEVEDSTVMMTKKELQAELLKVKQKKREVFKKYYDLKDLTNEYANTAEKLNSKLKEAAKVEEGSKETIKRLEKRIEDLEKELQTLTAELKAAKDGGSTAHPHDEDPANATTIKALQKVLEEQKKATADADHAAALYQASMTAAQKSALEARNALTVAIQNHEAELSFQTKKWETAINIEKKKQESIEAQNSSKSIDKDTKWRLKLDQLSKEANEAREGRLQEQRESSRLREGRLREQRESSRLRELVDKQNEKIRTLESRLNGAEQKPSNSASLDYRIPLVQTYRQTANSLMGFQPFGRPTSQGNKGHEENRGNLPSEPLVNVGEGGMKPWRTAHPNYALPKAKALYSFDAVESNDLSFPEGAVILGITFPDNGWWAGWYNNKQGLFPSNYVQLLG